MPLSAVVGPCVAVPSQAMPNRSVFCPAEPRDAYRIPKHRTRCLELLTAHALPFRARPKPAKPRLAVACRAEPNEAIRFGKASI